MDQFRRTPHAACDHRHALTHRFENRIAQPFPIPRMDNDMGGRKQAGDVVYASKENYGVEQTQFASQFLQVAALRPLAG